MTWRYLASSNGSFRNEWKTRLFFDRSPSSDWIASGHSGSRSRGISTLLLSCAVSKLGSFVPGLVRCSNSMIYMSSIGHGIAHAYRSICKCNILPEQKIAIILHAHCLRAYFTCTDLAFTVVQPKIAVAEHSDFHFEMVDMYTVKIFLFRRILQRGLFLA